MQGVVYPRIMSADLDGLRLIGAEQLLALA
jgi:hypothetical protein